MIIKRNKKERNWRRMLVTAVFCLLALAGPMSLSAQPNYYESQLIREKILNDFHVLIDIWTEELYFEMYQFGDIKSKGIMSQVEFAQRMVDLRWKPTLEPLLNERVNIIYRNFATIQFDQQFENKVNQTQTIWKRMIFPAVLENKTWKFSLKQLINIPYEGKIVDPEAERKAAAQAKAEAEKKAAEQAAAEQAQQGAAGADNQQQQPPGAAQDQGQQPPGAAQDQGQQPPGAAQDQGQQQGQPPPGAAQDQGQQQGQPQ